jgi:hypothetical protein
MSGERWIKGIGRLYSGKEFLDEVLYDLKITEGAIPGLMYVKGEICCLRQKQLHTLGREKLLRLDNGKVFEVMLVTGDALKGKYKCKGNECTTKGDFLPGQR